MSKENLNRILRDEKFEVIENMCYASDQSEGEDDEEYLRQTKTFGDVMNAKLSREKTQSIREASIMEILMRESNHKKVKQYFDQHFVHEIADVEDVTIWATVPGLDESCDDTLVMSPERSK